MSDIYRDSSFVPCIRAKYHPKVSVMFRRRPERPAHVRDTCDLCWFSQKMDNGTIIVNATHALHHKSPDSKPEKDSL